MDFGADLRHDIHNLEIRDHFRFYRRTDTLPYTPVGCVPREWQRWDNDTISYSSHWPSHQNLSSSAFVAHLFERSMKTEFLHFYWHLFKVNTGNLYFKNVDVIWCNNHFGQLHNSMRHLVLLMKSHWSSILMKLCGEFWLDLMLAHLFLLCTARTQTIKLSATTKLSLHNGIFIYQTMKFTATSMASR